VRDAVIAFNFAEQLHFTDWLL